MAFDISGSPAAPRSEINVTPLVDVVLVLLIIFMVITPLAQRGYDVMVPPKAKTTVSPPEEEGQIIVTVTPDNEIYINKEEVALDHLSLRLSAVLKNRSNPTVFFSAADVVNYGTAVSVIDILRSSGAKHIGVIGQYINPTATSAASAP